VIPAHSPSQDKGDAGCDLRKRRLCHPINTAGRCGCYATTGTGISPGPRSATRRSYTSEAPPAPGGQGSRPRESEGEKVVISTPHGTRTRSALATRDDTRLPRGQSMPGRVRWQPPPGANLRCSSFCLVHVSTLTRRLRKARAAVLNDVLVVRTASFVCEGPQCGFRPGMIGDVDLVGSSARVTVVAAVTEPTSRCRYGKGSLGPAIG